MTTLTENVDPEITAALTVATEVLRRIMMVIEDTPGIDIDTVRMNGRPGANIINLFEDAGRTFGATRLETRAAYLKYARRNA